MTKSLLRDKFIESSGEVKRSSDDTLA